MKVTIAEAAETDLERIGQLNRSRSAAPRG